MEKQLPDMRIGALTLDVLDSGENNSSYRGRTDSVESDEAPKGLEKKSCSLLQGCLVVGGALVTGAAGTGYAVCETIKYFTS